MIKHRLIMARRIGKGRDYLIKTYAISRAEEAVREIQLTPREYEVFFKLLLKKRNLEYEAGCN